MKKKLMVCSLLTLVILLMASTAFALNFRGDTAGTKGSSWANFDTELYYSPYMRAKLVNTRSYFRIDEFDLEYDVDYYAYLRNRGGDYTTGRYTVKSHTTKYMYPSEYGNQHLKIVNPGTPHPLRFYGKIYNQYY